MDNRLLIGIDGGGTKTDFVLCSVEGFIKKRIFLGTSNPNDIGIDNCCHILKKGISILLESENAIGGIYAGISGGTTGQNQNKIYCFLHNHFPTIAIQNNSDAAIVMSSCINSKQGIAVISGTGSVAFARENGILHRVGGWGFLFDEAGSGYNLGKDAIRAVLAEEDGTGETTLLTPLLYKEMHSSIWDSLDDIYAKGKPYIASFAPLVFQAYEKGDNIAKDIIRKSAHYLSELILKCSHLYDCGNDVVITGGLFNKKGILLPFMEEILQNNFHFIVPSTPPVYGALVECCNMQNIDADASFKNNFMNSLKEI